MRCIYAKHRVVIRLSNYLSITAAEIYRDANTGTNISYNVLP